MWYQALGENAPDHIHQMFASLIPGFPPQQPSPYKSERKIDGKKDKLVKVIGCDDKDKKEFYDTQLSQSTFHDNGSNQCPVTPVDSGPILPPQSGEKPLDNETVRFLEALLEFMVTQVYLHILKQCNLILPKNILRKLLFISFTGCKDRMER